VFCKLIAMGLANLPPNDKPVEEIREYPKLANSGRKPSTNLQSRSHESNI